MPHSDLPAAAEFIAACSTGDVDVLRGLLANDPSLARVGAHTDTGTADGRTARGRQARARRCRPPAAGHGADPNAREPGDNTTPLHWAAAHGHVDVVRALLDAGADVHGVGDLHEGDVIGWATLGVQTRSTEDVVTLLLERGARHHIFSAIAVGDLDLIRSAGRRTTRRRSTAAGRVSSIVRRPCISPSAANAMTSSIC